MYLTIRDEAAEIGDDWVHGNMLTRRSFLQTGTAAAAVSSVGAGRFLAVAEAGPSREPLRQMPYGAVQLTGGPFAEQYERLQAHYLALSNDRLLKVYRQRAGLPAPGADMGGWYDLDGFVPGHTLGQYISGLSRMAATGAPACRDKVHELVEGFAATLGPKNQSILRPDTNLWIAYTLDKHFAGLMDAGQLAGVSDAPDLLNRVLAGSGPLLPAQGHDRIGKKNPPYDETFVMPENLFLAARMTGNPAFTELAHRYMLDRELFDPLARGDDPFPGQHAYSHAIALSSAGRAYLEEGNPRYRQAMENAFTLLTTTQQFSSGGWGPNETFITPRRGELARSLDTTVDHFETPCGAYAATKLARYLLRTTPEPKDTRHADNLERVLYNTVLAVKLPDSDGDYPYYSTYSASAQKVYYGKKWPCCSGTLVQTVADYPLNVYLQSDAGLYVAQYTPSHVSLDVGGTQVSLQQETHFPLEDTTVLTVSPAHPASFALFLRIPAWVSGRATVVVNGRKAAAASEPGSWMALHRTWRAGDRVEVTLPQDFRTEAIAPESPEVVALMRGPVQYVALNPANVLMQGDKDLTARLAAPGRLKRISAQAFVEEYGGREVVFVPLYQVRDETYSSYFSKA